MNVTNINDIFQLLERTVKTGQIHLTLRTEADITELVEGEVFVDYSFDREAPVLKVIRDGKPEFLFTESDALFREFKRRILQVGTEPTNDGYHPSIYFKLNAGTNNSTGFDKDTITAFYNEFKNNENFKPYLQHVNTPEHGEHALYPFTDTEHIYFDASEIFEGAQDIKSLNDALVEFWNKLILMRDELKKSIDNLNANMEKVKNDFNEVDKIQDQMLDTLDKTNASNLEAIKDLHKEFDNLLANVEYGIRPRTFSLSHPNGNMVVPVLITVKGGREIAGDLKELFNTAVYIVDNLGNQMAKIGSDIMAENGTFADNDHNLEWTTRRVGEVTTIYDCKQVSSNSFVVLLKTGVYKVFNKRIETLVIEAHPEGIHGYTSNPPAHVYNPYINGSKNGGSMYRKFVTGMVVTQKIGLGNGISLKITNR